MKVSAMNKAFGFLNFVRNRQDGGGDGAGSFYSKNGSGRQRDPREQENRPEAEAVIEVTDEKVSAAVEAFGSDTQAKANGLSAYVEGRGPGLRVTLKDVNGSVIRQFSGEDFLKIRKATAGDKRPSGKILDQKL